MPWESFLLSYAAGKAIDTLIFSEKLRPRFSFKGFAERYQSLKADELISFYRSENPIEIELIGKRYILPMSAIIEYSNKKVSEIICEHIPEIYSVPITIIDYTKPVIEACKKNKNIHDGHVTRLVSYDDHKLLLQEASYYEGVATNFTIDHCPKVRTETLREMLHSEFGNLGEFKNNPLVNHIGVVCMIETGDGKLIVQKRSKKVTNRAGTLSSSVSGAIDWGDVVTKGTHFSILELAEPMIREAFEELHIKTNEIIFLGLVREFLRGGKPEMYFFAKTNEPFQIVCEQWKHAKDKSESKGLISYEFHSDRIKSDEMTKDAFKDRVRFALNEVGEKANLTLMAGIILTAKYLLEKAK